MHPILVDEHRLKQALKNVYINYLNYVGFVSPAIIHCYMQETLDKNVLLNRLNSLIEDSSYSETDRIFVEKMTLFAGEPIDGLISRIWDIILEPFFPISNEQKQKLIDIYENTHNTSYSGRNRQIRQLLEK